MKKIVELTEKVERPPLSVIIFGNNYVNNKRCRIFSGGKNAKANRQFKNRSYLGCVS